MLITCKTKTFWWRKTSSNKNFKFHCVFFFVTDNLERQTWFFLPVKDLWRLSLAGKRKYWCICMGLNAFYFVGDLTHFQDSSARCIKLQCSMNSILDNFHRLISLFTLETQPFLLFLPFNTLPHVYQLKITHFWCFGLCERSVWNPSKTLI